MDTEVAAVRAHARQLFEAQKGAAGLAAARQHFDQTLLDWVDVLAAEDEGLAMQGPQLPGAEEATATAADSSDSSGNSSEFVSARSRAARARAVSSLWLEWAALEKELKQWKQAVKTYDQVLRKCACLTCWPLPVLFPLCVIALFYSRLSFLCIFNLWPLPEERRAFRVSVAIFDGQAFINKITKPSFKRPLTTLKSAKLCANFNSI